TYLALGSNLGDRRSYLEQAVHEIQDKIGSIINVSKYYRTEPLNPENISEQPEFLNAAISCSTSLSAREVLIACQRIEANIGLDRSTKVPWGPRIIDIDIIAYGNEIIKDQDLTIPHAELCNRDFVLVPLQEISPKFTHPLSKLSIDILIENLKKADSFSHMIAVL
ncbi:MAG: 2-amino-4-hydroxy-6-hydroxymethyldihydropteridine diphosphokinase, partial [bacterium]|nr:2-amino-4-hydroxy-6-hydroxymethyldihydropteridine diphosphokinase [bacterium]